MATTPIEANVEQTQLFAKKEAPKLQESYSDNLFSSQIAEIYIKIQQQLNPKNDYPFDPLYSRFRKLMKAGKSSEDLFAGLQILFQDIQNQTDDKTRLSRLQANVAYLLATLSAKFNSTLESSGHYLTIAQTCLESIKYPEEEDKSWPIEEIAKKLSWLFLKGASMYAIELTKASPTDLRRCFDAYLACHQGTSAKMDIAEVKASLLIAFTPLCPWELSQKELEIESVMKDLFEEGLRYSRRSEFRSALVSCCCRTVLDSLPRACEPNEATQYLQRLDKLIKDIKSLIHAKKMPHPSDAALLLRMQLRKALYVYELGQETEAIHLLKSVSQPIGNPRLLCMYADIQVQLACWGAVDPEPALETFARYKSFWPPAKLHLAVAMSNIHSCQIERSHIYGQEVVELLQRVNFEKAFSTRISNEWWNSAMEAAVYMVKSYVQDTNVLKKFPAMLAAELTKPSPPKQTKKIQIKFDIDD